MDIHITGNPGTDNTFLEINIYCCCDSCRLQDSDLIRSLASCIIQMLKDRPKTARYTPQSFGLCQLTEWHKPNDDLA